VSTAIDHNELEANLRNFGSSWSAAQAHGLLCSRLAVTGGDGCADWIRLLFENVDGSSSPDLDSLDYLESVSAETNRQLSGRQSDFALILPDDTQPVSAITAALAEWCEGFLHGLVSDVKGQDLKSKLAAEPIGDIIKDLLELTRASADDDEDQEKNEAALTELVEYVRVATQLVYEELAELRHAGNAPVDLSQESDQIH